MYKKQITLFLIIFIGLSAIKFRCYKDRDVRPFEYTFEATVDIFPIKKTYSKTDTIWIETDLPNKILFDTRSNQPVTADSANIYFGGSFNEFGTYITNPVDGFCDIITINGVNTGRVLSHWSTGITLNNFSCNQPNYKCRIGFIPKLNGTYYLSLPQNLYMESCPGKIIPYYSQISYKYKNIDLGLDIFDSLSKNDKGGNDGIKFYHDAINNRQIFVFRVN